MKQHHLSKENRVPNHRLREERERRGLAQKDVAEAIDLPDTRTVGRWERGESFPHPHYRRKLCQLFGKSAEELDLVKAKALGNMQQPEPTQPKSKRASEFMWKVPLTFTSFVGRERDIADVCALLERVDVRLVTLLGAGGVGKTRLSIQVASELFKHFVDGVCFASLAAINDPALVLSTIAQELGLRESGAQSIIEQIKNVLHEKYFLLVLDNFEQVERAAPAVEELLTVCPRIKVLVTSRAVLHLQAEFVFDVGPLTTPSPAQVPAPETLLQYGAVALFVQRAQALLPAFQLTQSNAQSVAEICAYLDGLPLAIELAAARIKLLPPRALLAQISQNMQVLKERSLPERQQTLYNTIKWSYDLLGEQEQWFFRHLSVFVCGFTLSAAEVILGSERVLEVLNAIASLVDQSLLQQMEQDDEIPRFVMLETVRVYGLDFLQMHGEKEKSQNMHAKYYLALVEQAKPYLSGAQQLMWLAKLEQEMGNLRAALTWLNQRKETELVLHFSEAFGKFCGLQGYWREEQLWLNAALELPWTAELTMIRARVLRRAGHLAYRFRDLVLARGLLEESVVLSRASEDKQNLAGALSSLGWVLYRQKDIASASHFLYDAVAAARESGDKWAIANSLESLGRSRYFQGDNDEARRLLDESIVLAQELGDKENLARILTTLVSIEIAQGNIVQAAALAQESFTLAEELGTKPLIALAQDSLGNVAMFQGEYERAAQLFEERIMLAQELGDTPTIALKQLQLGDLALVQMNLMQAITFVQKSLRSFREQGDKPGIAAALSVLGDIKWTQGKDMDAKDLYKEAIFLQEEAGLKREIGRPLIGLATIALEQGQIEQAACLFGFAESCLKSYGGMHPAHRLNYERVVEDTRSRLEEQIFTLAWSEGRVMTLGEALAIVG